MSDTVWSVEGVERNVRSTPGYVRNERLEERREQVHERLGGGRHLHVAAERPALAGDALAQLVRLVEDAHGVGERRLAGARQTHAALATDEERLAQLLLERLDLVADGRLRQVQPLGGTGEVEGLGDHAKGTELRKLHVDLQSSVRRGSWGTSVERKAGYQQALYQSPRERPPAVSVAGRTG
jgi:hypothetical protein